MTCVNSATQCLWAHAVPHACAPHPSSTHTPVLHHGTPNVCLPACLPACVCHIKAQQAIWQQSYRALLEHSAPHKKAGWGVGRGSHTPTLLITPRSGSAHCWGLQWMLHLPVWPHLTLQQEPGQGTGEPCGQPQPLPAMASCPSCVPHALWRHPCPTASTCCRCLLPASPGGLGP
jgi:hypothetical protein